MAIPLKHDSSSTPQAEAPQQPQQAAPRQQPQDSRHAPRGSGKGQRQHDFKDRADK